MGNSDSRLKPLYDSLSEPVSYDSVLTFYKYLQENRWNSSIANYMSLENEMINNFLHLVSMGYYENKDEIEQISKLLTKMRKITCEKEDPDEKLIYIG
jgi:hypothetical protein